jgi:hypothetical protein
LRLSRLHILSELPQLRYLFAIGKVLTVDGRLNMKLTEDEMRFQDEGGLLLPPTIEQKVSSTGTLTQLRC